MAEEYGEKTLQMFEQEEDRKGKRKEFREKLKTKEEELRLKNREKAEGHRQRQYLVLHQAVKQRLENGGIGRNEPCPCMSGKKYKHCCVQNKPFI